MKFGVPFSLLWIAAPLLFDVVGANKAIFDEDVNSQRCAGVYAKSDWGGSIQPQITLQLTQFDNLKYDPKKDKEDHKEDISVSFVIFEYKDLSNIGVDLGDGHVKYICDDYAIETLGICDEKQKGKFLLNTNVTNTTILTSQFIHLGQADFHYPINKTGYYCVSTYNHDKKYKGVINFQNAFGQLSASEIPKLPAYGILTLCYAIALALFGFQFFKKRKENQILPLQRYLLAMLGFLTFDTLVVWSYYDLVNRTKNPSNAFVTFYMIFLSILNSAKITFSFFLLLCISLGYGVVLLKLNKSVMFKCKILAACHFVASTIYLVASYYNGSSRSITAASEMNQNSMGSILGLLPLIPITITLSIYYIMILVSIKKTNANLHKQRQVIKLQLYENLFRIIFMSVVLTFGGLILSSIIYLSMSTTEMIEEHWKAAFFIFEFWPSVIFFLVFMGIAWLWRPTETSYMLAISQQLSTGDGVDDDESGANGQGYHQGHEFELDDLSLLSHSDDEQRGPANTEHDSFELSRENQHNFPKSTDGPPGYEELDNKEIIQNPFEEGASSNDNGDTLFELGEDDDEEHQRLNDDGDDNDDDSIDDRLKSSEHRD
ncbi:lung seven transmembrane receptor-domain-containing protein [Scheffersomyces xylosifermentans]|uniref:lung seven transmembrane receptor-domain-containing protein n=1 Tax=Scheffersomyces xylosifermentans TaxID=1304137 RepID=UPI00315DD412